MATTVIIAIIKATLTNIPPLEPPAEPAPHAPLNHNKHK